jgi:DeoR/GlpR family transcriptional regulator of sugar metabolism
MLLTHERHKKIVDIVNAKQSVSNKELLSMLFVSEATLRRDLTSLELKGLITRTHGGASIKEATNSESSILIRSQKNIKEKKLIAQKCLDYIHNNDSIFIDSSSTVGNLLPLLSSFKDLTLITNGVSNALILSNTQVQASLHLTPGIFNINTNSVLGIDTIDYIKQYHCNLSIFSCGGISPYGITEANHEQSLIKREMMKRSKLHILLADHTKFEKIFMSQTCDFSDIDVLITDQVPTKEYLDLFETSECSVIIA